MTVTDEQTTSERHPNSHEEILNNGLHPKPGYRLQAPSSRPGTGANRPAGTSSPQVGSPVGHKSQIGHLERFHPALRWTRETGQAAKWESCS